MNDLSKMVSEVYAAWFSALGFGKRVLEIDWDAPEGQRFKLVWYAPKAPAYVVPVDEREILMNPDKLRELGRVKAEWARLAYRRNFGGGEEETKK